MPGAGSISVPHTYNALEDAVEQGGMFCNMLAKDIGNLSI